MVCAKLRLSSFSVVLCLSILSGLYGCGGSNTPATPLSANGLTAGGAASLYAIQSSASVLQFPLTGTSTNLTPTATITAPSGTTFAAVTTDSAGSIYVGGTLASGQGEVLVYAAGSTGAATPTRTILGGLPTTTTTFAQPKSMHISSAGTLVILSTTSTAYSVATMPATASGLVTPTTLLQGASTQITSPNCVTIDETGKVYVTNYASTGSVLTFAAGATGNTAPATVITTGSATPYGVAADASGNVFTVLDSTNGSSAGTLAVYAVGASGAATPTRTLTGSLTGIYFGGGVRLDTVGNLYMLNRSASSAFSIVAFTQGQSGNVAPGLTFSSTLYTSPSAEIAVR